MVAKPRLTTGHALFSSRPPRHRGRANRRPNPRGDGAKAPPSGATFAGESRRTRGGGGRWRRWHTCGTGRECSRCVQPLVAGAERLSVVQSASSRSSLRASTNGFAASTESLSRAAEQQWRGQQCRGQQSASSGATGFGASTQWRGQHSTTRRGHRFNSRRTRGGGGGRRAGQAGRPCVDASWELSLNVGR